MKFSLFYLFSDFGVDQGESSAMFEESMGIPKRALSGEKFAYDGEFWTIDDPIEIH